MGHVSTLPHAATPHTSGVRYLSDDARTDRLIEVPDRGSIILKKAALFGGIGAVAGFGISFLSIPIIGKLAAPLAAVVGGAIGVVAGIIAGNSEYNNKMAELQARVGWSGVAGQRPIQHGVLGKERSEHPALTIDGIAERLVDRLDEDKSGSIDLDDESPERAVISRLLTRADADHSGTVTEGEIAALLRIFDKNRDGVISRDEHPVKGSGSKGDTPTQTVTQRPTQKDDAEPVKTTPPVTQKPVDPKDDDTPPVGQKPPVTQVPDSDDDDTPPVGQKPPTHTPPSTGDDATQSPVPTQG